MKKVYAFARSTQQIHITVNMSNPILTTSTSTAVVWPRGCAVLGSRAAPACARRGDSTEIAGSGATGSGRSPEMTTNDLPLNL